MTATDNVVPFPRPHPAESLAKSQIERFNAGAIDRRTLNYTQRVLGPYRPPADNRPDPWKDLTRKLILAKASRGELDPAILTALLDLSGAP